METQSTSLPIEQATQELVYQLAYDGLSEKQIVKKFKLSRDSFTEFRDAFERGSFAYDLLVSQKQKEKALSGDNNMLQFLGIQRLGQRKEPEVIKDTKDDDYMSPAEIKAALVKLIKAMEQDDTT